MKRMPVATVLVASPAAWAGRGEIETPHTINSPGDPTNSNDISASDNQYTHILTDTPAQITKSTDWNSAAKVNFCCDLIKLQSHGFDFEETHGIIAINVVCSPAGGMGLCRD